MRFYIFIFSHRHNLGAILAGLGPILAPLASILGGPRGFGAVGPPAFFHSDFRNLEQNTTKQTKQQNKQQNSKTKQKKTENHHGADNFQLLRRRRLCCEPKWILTHLRPSICRYMCAVIGVRTHSTLCLCVNLVPFGLPTFSIPNRKQKQICLDARRSPSQSKFCFRYPRVFD